MEMDGEEVCTLEILLRSLTSHDYSDVMTAALGQIQDHIRLHVLLNNFMFNHQGTSVLQWGGCRSHRGRCL